MANHSKYKPEYCQAVIDCMRKGHSLRYFAADISVHHQTVYTWIKEHPEFGEAVDLARDQAYKWWEDNGLQGLFDVTTTTISGDERSTETRRFNAPHYKFEMINRFPGDYKSDKSALDINIPKYVLEALKSIQSMSDEDVKKLEEDMKK